MAIRLEDVWLDIDGRAVLRGVTGELKGLNILIGPNGSGKTVLLHAIAGILKPKRGRIDVEGVTSIMFQDPEVHFVAGTVLENAVLWGRGRSDEREIKEIAKELGIADLLNRSPFHLSWGQRRLSALLCALAGKPDVLLLDELPEGLSPRALKTAISAATSTAKTVVMTSHQFLELGWNLHFLADGTLYSGEEALAKAREYEYDKCRCPLFAVEER
ncbi:MAG: ATP-binding cassette domain-containing protein [Nitrososphaerota archaeon]|uniref:ATP-binding cassette domain-containing protein n=1 Tax=Pyrobaculum sp. TaxID=2004705 RepID=UPI00318227B4